MSTGLIVRFSSGINLVTGRRKSVVNNTTADIFGDLQWETTGEAQNTNFAPQMQGEHKPETQNKQ